MSSNLVDLLTASATAANYKSLVNAASFADLVETLKDDGLMLFAPSQTTFDGFPEVFRWNKAKLTKVLSNHVSADQTALTSEARDVETLIENTYSADQTKVDSIDITGNIEETVFLYDIDGVLLTDDDLPTPNLFETAADFMGDELKGFVSEELTNALKAISGKCPTTTDFCFEQGYTVFLPSKAAFANLLLKLKGDTGFKVGVTEYLADGGLNTALKAHTVGTAAPVTESGEFTSLIESGITLDFEAKTVTIAGASTTVNLDAVEHKNGNGHVIDEVLQFPRSSTVDLTVATSILSILKEKVIKYELDSVLAGLPRSTIFAPTDDAFKQIDAYGRWNPTIVTDENTKDIIKHHVLAAERLYAKDLPSEGALSVKSFLDESIDVSELSVNTADVLAMNGNIHIVDKVIIPPSLQSVVPSVNIAELAAAATPTLLSYLALFPDLVDLLTSTEDGKIFTVFAPNDEAFAALSAEDIVYLTDNDNKLLKEVLQYHVIQGTPARSSDLEATQKLTTASGAKMTVTVSDDGVVAQGSATVISADNLAYQGVVHVVNQVIIPPGIELPSQGGSASSLTISAVAMAVASFFAAAF